jgi:hypothetical protein
VQLRPFVGDAVRLGLTDDDLLAIEGSLLAEPLTGTVMSGTGGLRRMRCAPIGRGTGKSGGVRVCYAFFPRFSQVYFIAAFDKHEQENLTPAERRSVRSLLSEIDLYLGATRP